MALRTQQDAEETVDAVHGPEYTAMMAGDWQRMAA
jgi:hypothetical protein